MSRKPQEPLSSNDPRARFTSLWGVLALEITVIAALVVGIWWFIGSHEEGWPVAGVLLDPILWVLVLVISAAGAAGNLALYYLGRGGTEAVFERFPQLEGERWERIGAYYQRYGARVLILSAIPGLGTLLTTGAGAFNIERNVFLVWVFLAKLLRNWLIVFLLLTGFQGLFSS